MSEFGNLKFRQLDGTLLLVFRELVRRRRGVEVADHLGLTPSAISHNLTRLRMLFDDPLFIRRPHGLEPTRYALQLAPKLEALIDMSLSLLGPSETFDPATSDRRFSFSAPEFVTALIGAPLIKRLGRAAPKVMFDVQFQVHGEALEGLRKGEFDFALGRFGNSLPRLYAEDLYEDEFCVVARQGHPRVCGAIDLSTYSELGHVVAGSPSEGALGADVQHWFNSVSPVAVVPRWLTALVLVAGSDAIATCPRRLAQRHAEALGLQVIASPMSQEPFTVSWAARSPQLDEATSWFLNELRACV